MPQLLFHPEFIEALAYESRRVYGLIWVGIIAVLALMFVIHLIVHRHERPRD